MGERRKGRWCSTGAPRGAEAQPATGARARRAGRARARGRGCAQRRTWRFGAAGIGIGVLGAGFLRASPGTVIDRVAPAIGTQVDVTSLDSRTPTFGTAVAARGDTFLVGAPRAEVDGVAQGAVLVCGPGPGGGLTVLPPPRVDAGGAVGDGFGEALAVLGPWLAVGAPRAVRTHAGVSSVGRVWLYRRNAAGLDVPMARLEPQGGGAVRFGAALALSPGATGPGLAVGAPRAEVAGHPAAGRVECFVPDGGTWRRAVTLHAGAPSVAANFGDALAWVGDTLVVGAPGDGAAGPGAGRIFGFGPAGDLRFTLGPLGLGVDLGPGAGPGPGLAGCRMGATLAALGPSSFAVGLPGRGRIAIVSLDAGRPVVGATEVLAGEVLDGFGVALAGNPGGSASESRLAVGLPWATAPRVEIFGPDADGCWRPLERIRAPGALGVPTEFGIALAFEGATLVVGEPATGPEGGRVHIVAPLP